MAVSFLFAALPYPLGCSLCVSFHSLVACLIVRFLDPTGSFFLLSKEDSDTRKYSTLDRSMNRHAFDARPHMALNVNRNRALSSSHSVVGVAAHCGVCSKVLSIRAILSKASGKARGLLSTPMAPLIQGSGGGVFGKAMGQ